MIFLEKMKKIILILGLIIGISIFILLLFVLKNQSVISNSEGQNFITNQQDQKNNNLINTNNVYIEPKPEKLSDPPSEIKAIYADSWSISNTSTIDRLITIIKKHNFNALVFDVQSKDGNIAYDFNNAQLDKYNIKKDTIGNIDILINKLHKNNIYTIARIVCFKNTALALNNPNLAIKINNKIWKDNSGMSWLDPSSKDVWNFVLTLAKDIKNHSVDEINFDYMRFPSDGAIDLLQYPFYQNDVPKKDIINNFFKYLRQNLSDIKISADVFGQTTSSKNDMGIGQIIENAYKYFDYVSPMIYPSLYVNNFLDFENSHQHPYEIVKYEVQSALERLIKMQENSSTTIDTKLRPWLQAFSLDIDYTPEMIQKEIQGYYDSIASTTFAGLTNGFMLWDTNNIYNF
ncbi:MAG: putative glycoside hydrolase [Minisyncoccia bacterium]